VRAQVTAMVTTVQVNSRRSARPTVTTKLGLHRKRMELHIGGSTVMMEVIQTMGGDSAPLAMNPRITGTKRMAVMDVDHQTETRSGIIATMIIVKGIALTAAGRTITATLVVHLLQQHTTPAHHQILVKALCRSTWPTRKFGSMVRNLTEIVESTRERNISIGIILHCNIRCACHSMTVARHTCGCKWQTEFFRS
jgi:hypothetical protein